MGHTYTKQYSLFIYNSNLTRCPPFIFSKSGKFLCGEQMHLCVVDMFNVRQRL